jgi:hypothetical protein
MEPKERHFNFCFASWLSENGLSSRCKLDPLVHHSLSDLVSTLTPLRQWTRGCVSGTN